MIYKILEFIKSIIDFLKESYHWYCNYLPVRRSIKQLKRDLRIIEKTDPVQFKRIKKALKDE